MVPHNPKRTVTRLARLIRLSPYRLMNESGFTLFQILIGVVIIGIVAAMAVPRFQIAMERTQFRGANWELKSIIRVARSHAIAKGVPYGVYFNGTYNNSNQGSALQYTLFKDIDHLDEYRYDNGDSILSIDTLTPSVTYMDTGFDNDVLVFTPDGVAHYSGVGTIVTLAMTDDIMGAASFSIVSSTGYAKISSMSY